MGETSRVTGRNAEVWESRHSGPHRRSTPWGPCLALTIAAVGAFPGCDSDAFVPSRPPELTGSSTAASTASGTVPSATPATTIPKPSTAPSAKTTATPTARARLVEYLLAQPASVDRLYLEQFLRRETGIKRCAFPEHDSDG